MVDGSDNSTAVDGAIVHDVVIEDISVERVDGGAEELVLPERENIENVVAQADKTSGCTAQPLTDFSCEGQCPFTLAWSLQCEHASDISLATFDGVAHVVFTLNRTSARPGVLPYQAHRFRFDHKGDVEGSVTEVESITVVRIGEDGEPVLITREMPNVGVVSLRRDDEEPTRFDVPGEPWEVALTDDGALRVLTSPFVSTLPSNKDHWLFEGTVPTSFEGRIIGSNIFAPILFGNDLVYFRREGSQYIEHLSRSGEIESITSTMCNIEALSAISPIIAGDVSVSWDTEGTIWTAGIDVNPSVAFSAPRTSYNICHDSKTRTESEKCPGEQWSTELENELYAHALIQGYHGEPWLVAWTADGEGHCRWYEHGNCSDGMPCECIKNLSREYRVSRIRLGSLHTPDRYSSYELATVGRLRLLRAQGDGTGRLLILLAWYNDESQPVSTGAYLMFIDTLISL